MSMWVSVYCQKQIGNLQPSDLVAAIRDRLNAFSDPAQEDPKEALARLRVEELAKTDDFQLLHLHYLAADLPIVVLCFFNREEVAAEVQGCLEQLSKDRQGPSASVVREHLAQVVEINHFCFKQQHADGIGTPLVYAGSSWLAQRGKGLIRVEGRGWVQLTPGGEFAALESQ